ncbi:hypothetical protein [Anatilimnocola floriformis]|uniref:hypothetical protein n=1 Tax=Anatilimnocola floriformis TaxID=2948575 RepID=UPI0020C2D400|nr:hypothetical protein [Anatilimnocola floriformis]
MTRIYSLVLLFGLTAVLFPAIALGQAKTKPAPAIPGLPELPPGVELPPEVEAQLKKALQDAKAMQDAAKAKQPTKPVAPPQPAPKPTAPKATPPVAPAPTTPKTASPKNSSPKTTPPKVTAPATPAATTFKRNAQEKSLAKIGDVNFGKRDAKKPHFWISSNGRRVAWLLPKGIAVDDKTYEYPNFIRQQSQYVMNFRFSPDGQRTSWVIRQDGTQGAAQGETLVVDGVPEKIGWNFIATHDGGTFSNDSKHVAYTARRYAKGDVEYVLIINGQEREIFPKSSSWKLTFSPDNQRVIWAEDTGDHYEVRESSIDGSQPRIERKFGPAQLTMNFFYGPAGELGYVASHKGAEKFLVYDGKELKPSFKELKGLKLSRDGHLAFVAEPENFRDVVVIDGRASPLYGGLEPDYVDNSLALSPLGGRSAYAIEKSRRQTPVIDGKEGKAYARVAQFTFSPDGQRLAYWAAQNNKLHMVLDGKESAAYDELGLPVFSPDGKSFAHSGGVGPKQWVVLNGQPQKAYASVGEPEFTPDSKRLVYLADLSDDGPMLVVDGGKEGKAYDAIQEQLYLSPAGRVAMVAHEGEQQLVVVDGVEGNRYDRVLTLGGGKVTFTDENHWHYLAVKNGELLLVEESNAE